MIKNRKSNNMQSNIQNNEIDILKQRSNIIMLDKIPKWVCIALCIVSLVYVLGTIIVITLGIEDGKNVSQIIGNMITTDIISMGVAVIGIAVSVWVGLNIYIAFSREENEKLKQAMENTLENAREEMEEIQKQSQETRTAINELLIQDLLNVINRTSNRYMLSMYLSYLFERINLTDLDAELIRNMINGESNYILAVDMYESERHQNCIEKSIQVRRHFEGYLEKYKSIKEKLPEDSFRDRVIDGYLKVRISDMIFYKNASIRRSKSGHEFNIDEMGQSTEIYKKMREMVNDITPEYEEKVPVLAYIDNTIGYTYDLMNQVQTDSTRVEQAVTYMEKSVEKLGAPWKDKKARYLRNLGLTYERMEDLNAAKGAYLRSKEADEGDYKTWNNIGAITIKILEAEKNISKREKILPEFDADEFIPYTDELKGAQASCEMAISLAPMFKDPYYKLIQIHTYLYLSESTRGNEIKDAEKYINILNGIKYDQNGYKFAYRNYFEALGNIEKANEINEQIKPTDKNDVAHLRELYKKHLKPKKTEE